MKASHSQVRVVSLDTIFQEIIIFKFLAVERFVSDVFVSVMYLLSGIAYLETLSVKTFSRKV